jgi:hypothetical protein
MSDLSLYRHIASIRAAKVRRPLAEKALVFVRFGRAHDAARFVVADPVFPYQNQENGEV